MPQPSEPHDEPQTLADRACDAALDAAAEVLGSKDRARVTVLVAEVENPPEGEMNSASATTNEETQAGAIQLLQDLLSAANNVAASVGIDLSLIFTDQKGQG